MEQPPDKLHKEWSPEKLINNNNNNNNNCAVHQTKRLKKNEPTVQKI